MRITANHIDMLYRIALAVYFTSPTTAPTYDRQKVITALDKRQLIRFDSVRRWLLTEEGTEILNERGSREQLATLTGCARRRAARS